MFALLKGEIGSGGVKKWKTSAYRFWDNADDARDGGNRRQGKTVVVSPSLAQEHQSESREGFCRIVDLSFDGASRPCASKNMLPRNYSVVVLTVLW